LISPGLLVTVPFPVPALFVVRVNVMLKVAVTVVVAVTVTAHEPVPLHPPPLQPAKTDPAAAVAVNVTAVPVLKVAEQVDPQFISPPPLVTVPDPVPDLMTVKAKVLRANIAVAVVLAVTVTLHVPVPLQPPPVQPANVEPEAAVAVSVTMVPLLKFALHVPGQLIPVGLLVTVPVPVPGRVTVSAKEGGRSQALRP